METRSILSFFECSKSYKSRQERILFFSSYICVLLKTSLNTCTVEYSMILYGTVAPTRYHTLRHPAYRLSLSSSRAVICRKRHPLHNAMALVKKMQYDGTFAMPLSVCTPSRQILYSRLSFSDSSAKDAFLKSLKTCQSRQASGVPPSSTGLQSLMKMGPIPFGDIIKTSTLKINFASAILSRLHSTAVLRLDLVGKDSS